MEDEKHKYVTITFSSGGETLTPIRYNTVSIAPIVMQMTFVADDPTKLDAAIRRTQKFVDTVYEERFEFELERHMRHHRQAYEAVVRAENERETERVESVRRKRSEAG